MHTFIDLVARSLMIYESCRQYFYYRQLSNATDTLTYIAFFEGVVLYFLEKRSTEVDTNLKGLVVNSIRPHKLVMFSFFPWVLKSKVVPQAYAYDKGYPGGQHASSKT